MFKKYALTFCLFWMFNFLFLNAQNCGTTDNCGISKEAILRGQNYNNAGRANGIKYVKLKVRIASFPGSGGDALSKVDFERALKQANNRFLPSNIQFVVCGDIDIVDDINLYYFNNLNTLNTYHVYGYLNVNICYHQSFIGNYGGFAFPDDILLEAFSAGTAAGLEHELGHELGLYHTHETAFGAELVNGSNCTTAGDLICDTPADPYLYLYGVDYQTCAYTGTATDANGQQYNPMVNNIMAYSIYTCRNAFTAGQNNVMNYVLDSIKTYLRMANTPVIIDSIPYQFCSYDPSFPLSATPPGGTFTGTQVSSNNIIIQNSPPATFSVYYVPPNSPDTATNYIDQYSYTNTIADTSNNIWQSFTTRETGNITALDFYLQNLAAGNINFSIYAGNGTSGSLIYTSTVFVDSMNAPAWVSFPIDIILSPPTGTIYTAQINSSSFSFIFYRSQVYFAWYVDYLHGISNYTDQDIAFREWINGVPSCQDAYAYYKVYVPPNGSFNNLPAYYCSGEDTLTLLGDQPEGSFFIDGLSTTIILPSELTQGSHQILYISNSQGCFDSTASVVEITNSTTSFQNLISPICNDGGTFPIVSLTNGGIISIDTIISNVFDPSSLGIGMHYIHYLNNSLHDTITFAEQRLTTSNWLHYTSLSIDSTFYQSFKANQSGWFNGIKIKYYNDFDTLVYATTFRKGTGLLGSLIIADTINIPAIYNTFNYPNLFPNPLPIYIEKDSTYTFSIQALPGQNPSQLAQIEAYGNNSYPSGISNLVDTALNSYDFNFQEIITIYTGCDVTGLDSVYVDVCTDLKEANVKNNIAVYPNPANDFLIVSTGSKKAVITLYNALAEIVYKIETTESIMKVNVHNFASGTYYIHVQTENECYSKLIIKND